MSKLSEAKHHVEVKVDMDELDLTSVEAKATYREIEEWGREKKKLQYCLIALFSFQRKLDWLMDVSYNLANDY